MKPGRILLVGLAAAAFFSSPASAATTVVRGKIIVTQGHQSPACRTVMLRRASDNQPMYFRIAATGVEDGIMAVTITAVTTRLDVEITYDPAVTSGCGSEPAIQYISLIAAG
jgi:hypothetical protein